MPPSPIGVSIGTMIGAFRIDGVLAEGGMGVVYAATDTTLNRPVAVKFLSEHLLDASARRRFQREAQMASSLNHPHILRFTLRASTTGASISSRSTSTVERCTTG